MNKEKKDEAIEFSYGDGSGAQEPGVIKLDFEGSESYLVLQGKELRFNEIETIEAERTFLFVGFNDGRVLDFQFSDEGEAEEIRRLLSELVGFFNGGK